MQTKSQSIGRWLEYLCAAFLGVIVFVVFANVVGRYFFSAPIRWSDEVAQYIFLWLSYLGALAALMRGNHYSIPNLIEMLPRIPRAALKTISDLIVLAILGTLIWYGYQLVDRLSFQRSLTLGLPVYYVYSALPLTATLMALFVCSQIINRLRGAPLEISESERMDERP